MNLTLKHEGVELAVQEFLDSEICDDTWRYTEAVIRSFKRFLLRNENEPMLRSPMFSFVYGRENENVLDKVMSTIFQLRRGALSTWLLCQAYMFWGSSVIRKLLTHFVDSYQSRDPLNCLHDSFQKLFDFRLEISQLFARYENCFNAKYHTDIVRCRLPEQPTLLQWIGCGKYVDLFIRKVPRYPRTCEEMISLIIALGMASLEYNKNKSTSDSDNRMRVSNYHEFWPGNNTIVLEYRKHLRVKSNWAKIVLDTKFYEESPTAKKIYSGSSNFRKAGLDFILRRHPFKTASESHAIMLELDTREFHTLNKKMDAWVLTNPSTVNAHIKRYRGFAYTICYLSLYFPDRRRHANLLLVNHKSKTIYRVDPHGELATDSELIDEVLSNAFVDRVFSYENVSLQCPNVQENENKLKQCGFEALLESKVDGYCATFVFMIADKLLSNPNDNVIDVIRNIANRKHCDGVKELYDYVRKIQQTARYMALVV